MGQVHHPQTPRALATFVAQLFSCLDGEHCFIRARAHWQLLLLNYLVAWMENTALYEGARAQATFVGQLFSCLDGEHCFIRARAHRQLLLLNYLVAWMENTAL
jgi:hypothetical protein